MQNTNDKKHDSDTRTISVSQNAGSHLFRHCRNAAITVCFLFAFGLSFLSFFSSRVSSLEELTVLCNINFLVIGPLWSVTAFLYFRGKTRIVLAILALILPASGLSLFQSAITYARFTPSPRSVTFQLMRANAIRIQEYMKIHRQAPLGLSVLPAWEGFKTTEDGWGNEIQYSVDEGGIITLTSFGADGKPGGDGRDADIIERYQTRKADGTLNVDDKSWASHARIGA